MIYFHSRTPSLCQHSDSNSLQMWKSSMRFNWTWAVFPGVDGEKIVLLCVFLTITGPDQLLFVQRGKGGGVCSGQKEHTQCNKTSTVGRINSAFSADHLSYDQVFKVFRIWCLLAMITLNPFWKQCLLSRYFPKWIVFLFLMYLTCSANEVLILF